MGVRRQSSKEVTMNSLCVISILCWVAMLIAFHTGHPIGYTIAILGFAASAAIADELSSQRREPERDRPSSPEHLHAARSAMRRGAKPGNEQRDSQREAA
jgi:hypothetical protein